MAKKPGNDDDEYEPAKKRKSKSATNSGLKTATNSGPKSAPKAKSTERPARSPSPQVHGSSARILQPTPKKLNRPTKKPPPAKSPSPDAEDTETFWDKDLRADGDPDPPFTKKKGGKGTGRKPVPKKSFYGQLDLNSDVTNDGVMPTLNKPTTRTKKPVSTTRRQRVNEENEELEVEGSYPNDPKHNLSKKAVPPVHLQKVNEDKKENEEVKVIEDSVPMNAFQSLAQEALETILHQDDSMEDQRLNSGENPDLMETDYDVAQTTLQTTHHLNDNKENEELDSMRDSYSIDPIYDVAENVPTASHRNGNNDDGQEDVMQDFNPIPQKRDWATKLTQALENAGELPVSPVKSTTKSATKSTTKIIKRVDFKPTTQTQVQPPKPPNKSPAKRLPSAEVIDDRVSRKSNLINFGSRGPRNQGVPPKRRGPSAIVNAQGSPMLGSYEPTHPVGNLVDLTQQPDTSVDLSSDFDDQSYDDGIETAGREVASDEMVLIPTQVEVKTKIDQRPTGSSTARPKALAEATVSIPKPTENHIPFRQPLIETTALKSVAKTALSAPKQTVHVKTTEHVVYKPTLAWDTQPTTNGGIFPPPNVVMKRADRSQEPSPAKQAKQTQHPPEKTPANVPVKLALSHGEHTKQRQKQSHPSSDSRLMDRPKVERIKAAQPVPIQHPTANRTSHNTELQVPNAEVSNRRDKPQNPEPTRQDQNSTKQTAPKTLSERLQRPIVQQQPVQVPRTPTRRPPKETNLDDTLVDSELEEGEDFEDEYAQSPGRRHHPLYESSDSMAEDDKSDYEEESNTERHNQYLPQNQQSLHEVLLDLTEGMVFRFGQMEVATRVPLEQFERGGRKLIDAVAQARNDDLEHRVTSLRTFCGQVRAEVERMVDAIESRDRLATPKGSRKDKGIDSNLQNSLDILKRWKGWEQVEEEGG